MYIYIVYSLKYYSNEESLTLSMELISKRHKDHKLLKLFFRGFSKPGLYRSENFYIYNWYLDISPTLSINNNMLV